MHRSRRQLCKRRVQKCAGGCGAAQPPASTPRTSSTSSTSSIRSRASSSTKVGVAEPHGVHIVVVLQQGASQVVLMRWLWLERHATRTTTSTISSLAPRPTTATDSAVTVHVSSKRKAVEAGRHVMPRLLRRQTPHPGQARSGGCQAVNHPVRERGWRGEVAARSAGEGRALQNCFGCMV